MRDPAENDAHWPGQIQDLRQVRISQHRLRVGQVRTFTNWLSPYGGHETSPWHYLGGDRAAARYQRKHGKMPKNRFRESLYPISVAEALGWARLAQGVVVVDAVPRYLPGWTRPLLRVPMLREFLSWNLLPAAGNPWRGRPTLRSVSPVAVMLLLEDRCDHCPHRAC
jgi:hypothetical protein